MWNLNCLMLYVCGGVLLPLCTFGSQNDFWELILSPSIMWVQGLNSGSQIWWQVFLLTETAPLYRPWIEWKVWIVKVMKVKVDEAPKYE